jgi:hypothetical protein
MPRPARHFFDFSPIQHTAMAEAALPKTANHLIYWPIHSSTNDRIDKANHLQGLGTRFLQDKPRSQTCPQRLPRAANFTIIRFWQ